MFSMFLSQIVLPKVVKWICYSPLTCETEQINNTSDFEIKVMFKMVFQGNKYLLMISTI